MEIKENHRINILPILLKAYADEGYLVSVGLNPLRESGNGPLAYIFKTDKDGVSSEKESVSQRLKSLLIHVKQILMKFTLFYIPYKKIKSLFWPKKVLDQTKMFLGGIDFGEIYFFENILRVFTPKCFYLVGVARGWSTIALGLMSPGAVLYGIDNLCGGVEAREGFALTERIAKNLSINLSLYVGSSPTDTSKVLNNIDGKVDFVFIDGLHTNEQVFADFMGVLPYLTDSVVVVFHDLLNWNMLDGWEKIITVAQKANFQHRILRRTYTGMSVLYRNVSSEAEDAIGAFFQDPSVLCPT